MSLLPPVDAFHAFIYGSSVWYLIRGATRILVPKTVFRWFEAHPTRAPTSLELYNIRTDALGLVLIGVLLIGLSGVHRPGLPVLRKSSHKLPKTAGPFVETSWKLNAQIAIAGVILHHLGTAVFAYFQWADSATATGAMLLGWAYSSGISLLGVAAWLEVQRVSTSPDPPTRRKSIADVSASTATSTSASPKPRTPKTPKTPKV